MLTGIFVWWRALITIVNNTVVLTWKCWYVLVAVRVCGIMCVRWVQMPVVLTNVVFLVSNWNPHHIVYRVLGTCCSILDSFTTLFVIVPNAPYVACYPRGDIMGCCCVTQCTIPPSWNTSAMGTGTTLRLGYKDCKISAALPSCGSSNQGMSTTWFPT